VAKSGGLRSLKALEFEKWGLGRLEPSCLTEVYAYGHWVDNAMISYGKPNSVMIVICKWLININFGVLAAHLLVAGQGCGH